MDLSDSEKIRRAVIAWMTSEMMKSGNGQAALVYSYFEHSFYLNGKHDLINTCFKFCIESSN
jgi:hypothetical protein